MKDKLRKLAVEMRDDLCSDFAEKLEAILDAEAAPRTVTDEDTGVFHDDLMQRESGQRQWSTMGTYQRGCWIAALQAYEERRK